jgi:cytochrome c biogenesis protein CcdA/thiol-disulfide isomerase/thioredoxin
MLLYLLTFLAGALTILSPCILPVLPFVFARGQRGFWGHGLPLLLGMMVMFAAVGSLAAFGGGWAVAANNGGRVAALVIMAGFGLTLLVPSLADRLSRPLVALGWRWSQGAGEGWGGSLVLGLATGLLWAPCAGPILGLVLTGAALRGGGLETGALLLAYGAGAALSLGLALLAGGAVFGAMKRSLGVGVGVRRVLGGVVLAGVAAIALGLDTGALSRLSQGGTGRIEQALLDRFGMAPAARAEGMMPGFDGATLWLNSPALTPASLRGKVVLVDFWTYSCINCLRTLPYVRGWAEKYRKAGLVVIGVHSPEFAFEHDAGQVRAAVARLGVRYPVVLDNDFAIWRAYKNEYWPAHYLIDAQGRIVAHHFGEGGEAETEAEIQRLLMQASGQRVPGGLLGAPKAGVEAERSGQEQTPETYLGTARAERFAGRPALAGVADYRTGDLAADQWGLDGRWNVGEESAVLERAGGAISAQFRARDVHLVLGAQAGPVRFRVSVDGRAPGADHGVDCDAQGNGLLRDHRLYQLLRMQAGAGAHRLRIEFLDSGAQAFSFTFG